MIQNCPMCGKAFEIMWPDLWVYKRNKRFICSWSCLRAADKMEGVEKKVKLSEREQKAVEIALEGGNPVEFLKKESKNASAAWYHVKQKVKETDPETYAKLPARIVTEKKPEPAEEPNTATVTKVDEVPKITQPVVYDGMTVREIEGGFGRYRRSDVHGSIYIDFEYTEGADVISLTDKQWRSFMVELIHASQILGVSL